jgi:transposase
MLTIKLSEAEISTLRYEMYHYPDAIVQKRLHVIYLKGTQNKLSCNQIGSYTGLHRATVSAIIHTYNSGGIAALKYNNYGTNTSELQQYRTTIIEDLIDNPVYCLAQAKERVENLTGQVRSLSSIRTFLRANNFRLRKIGHIPAKADTEKQLVFLEKELNPIIEKAKNGDLSLFFMDSAHFVLGAFLCSLWSINRLFIPSPAGRQRLNVIGAINAITKQLYCQTNTSYVNAFTVTDFLRFLRRQIPKLPIVIVLDNARYQHCKFAVDIAQSLGITFLFLPPYSPNLNIIERLWKFVKKKVLYAKYYSNFNLFQTAITECLYQVNNKYHHEVDSLCTLNFQTFENVTFYPK